MDYLSEKEKETLILWVRFWSCCAVCQCRVGPVSGCFRSRHSDDAKDWDQTTHLDSESAWPEVSQAYDHRAWQSNFVDWIKFFAGKNCGYEGLGRGPNVERNGLVSWMVVFGPGAAVPPIEIASTEGGFMLQ